MFCNNFTQKGKKKTTILWVYGIHGSKMEEGQFS